MLFMFLILLAAFVVSIIAIRKAGDLQDRVHYLNEDMKKLRGRLKDLEIALFQGRGSSGAPPDQLEPLLPPLPRDDQPPLEPISPADAVPPPPPVKPKPKKSSAPPPASPSINWEAFLGIRAAAWAGAIALVISGSLYVKYAIENDLIAPELRVAMTLGVGVVGIVVAEVVLRRGYTVTANALCGAGAALLYIGFFAARVLYGLIPFPVAFAGFVLVTVATCALAIRHDAMFIALLGLVGGFATPLVLSTGEDNAVGLFSYVLLLDVGLVLIAIYRGWGVLTMLSLAGTFVMELLWFGKHMAPEKIGVATVAFGLFGICYLLFPLFSRSREQTHAAWTGVVGGLIPFVFALFMVTDPAYAADWLPIFALLLCIDAAFLLMGILGGLTMALPAAAFATAVAEIIWIWNNLELASMWPVAGVFAVLAVFFGSAEGLARRYRPEAWEKHRGFLWLAGMIAGLGLALAAAVMVSRLHADALMAFVFLLVVVVGLMLTRIGRAQHEGVVRLATLIPSALLIFWVVGEMWIETVWVAVALTGTTAAVFNLMPWYGKRFGQDLEASRGTSLSGSGFIAALATAAIILIMISRLGGGSTEPFIVLWGVLSVLMIYRIGRADSNGMILLGSLIPAFLLSYWAGLEMGADTAWIVVAVSVAFTAVYNVLPRLGEGFGRELDPWREERLGYAGIVAALALGFVTLLIARDCPLENPLVFFVPLAVLAIVSFERGSMHEDSHMASLGPLATAILVQIWYFANTSEELVPAHLAMATLVPVAWVIVSAIRYAARPETRSEPLSTGDVELGSLLACAVGFAGMFVCLGFEEMTYYGGALLPAITVLGTLVITCASRRDATWTLPFLAIVCAAWFGAWEGTEASSECQPLSFYTCATFYVALTVLPFIVPRMAAPHWGERNWPWVTSGIAGPLFFLPLYRMWDAVWTRDAIGLLPVAMAVLSLLVFAMVRKRFSGTDAPDGYRLRYMALLGAVTFGFITLAVPLQLERQWITIAWALEAVAVWWLYTRVPHWGLKYFGAALLLSVAVRLLLNAAVFEYEERSRPILNWILYTYGISGVCYLVSGSIMKRVEIRNTTEWADPFYETFSFQMFSIVSYILGIVVIFALINLEVADYYSTGRYVTLSVEHSYARDLTTSAAWGAYALIMLGVGMAKESKWVRWVSMLFLLLTVGKVFLYDLSHLAGIHRVMSFAGLALSLIVVSLAYRMFVFKEE